MTRERMDHMPFWKLYYHIVWATAKREPMIDSRIERQVYEAIKAKAQSLGGEVFGVNGVEEHVHLVTTIPPSIAIARFVGEVKGSSSFHVNHLPNNDLMIDWQRGYGVVSFRNDNLEQVLEYVRRQKEHHAAGKTWSSLEDCGEEDASKPTCVREEAEDYDPYT
jgi:putative transposase